MPFISPIARDGFDGANTADIAGRTLDGDGTPALGVGVWAFHAAGSVTVGKIGIVGNVAVKQGADDAVARYVINSIPSLPSTYRTELRAVFPETDTGGTPGTDPYVEPWRYKVTDGSGTVYEDGLVADLVTDQTFAYNGGTFQLDSFVLWPSGQPKTWEFEHDAGGRLHVHFYTRVHKTATGSHTYPLTLTWTQARDPELIDPPGPDENTYSNYGGSYFVNNLPVGGVPIPLGPQNVAPDHIYPPFYYPDGQPATVTYTPTATTTALPTLEFRLEGEPGSSDPGRISIDEWAEMALDGTTIFDVGIPPSGGNEWAYFEACVRHDPTLDTGYLLGVEFSHLGASPKIFYWLYEFDDGVYTLLRQSAGLIDYAHGLATLGSLEIDGANILHAYDATGALLWDFNIGTDLADGTGAVVALHATGLPGISAWDDSDGAWMHLEQCTVYLAAPCTGDPDNPYPTDPPPVEPVIPLVYVMSLGAWRGAPVTDIQPRQLGGHRMVPESGYVRAMGAWRLIADPEVENPPPPNTDLPPYYDPCESLPPLPLPPGVPLDPPPVRFFGMQDVPTTVLGGLFNGTRRALGSHTPGELAQAAARGGIIHCGIGGYDKFLPGGAYSPAVMDDYIESHLPYAGALQSYQTAGTFLGVDILDDFRSERRWPPSGINDTEVTRIVTKWKTLYPWMRVGIRGRPSQFASHISGIDFYTTQFKYWGTPSNPTAFRNAEGGIAASRNADVLWAINYEDGGLGSSGFRHSIGWEMTAAEVLGCLIFAQTPDTGASRNLGIGGFKYEAAYLARPGMLDALAILRNTLAALPPP